MAPTTKSKARLAKEKAEAEARAKAEAERQAIAEAEAASRAKLAAEVAAREAEERARREAEEAARRAIIEEQQRKEAARRVHIRIKASGTAYDYSLHPNTKFSQLHELHKTRSGYPELTYLHSGKAVEPSSTLQELCSRRPQTATGRECLVLTHARADKAHYYPKATRPRSAVTARPPPLPPAAALRLRMECSRPASAVPNTARPRFGQSPRGIVSPAGFDLTLKTPHVAVASRINRPSSAPAARWNYRQASPHIG